jgi:hypothetical protein
MDSHVRVRVTPRAGRGRADRRGIRRGHRHPRGSARWRAATLKAVDATCVGRARFEVEHIVGGARVRAGVRARVGAGQLAVSRPAPIPLVGAQPVEMDAESAAALAALKAVNRTLSLVLRLPARRPPPPPRTAAADPPPPPSAGTAGRTRRRHPPPGELRPRPAPSDSAVSCTRFRPRPVPSIRSVPHGRGRTARTGAAAVFLRHAETVVRDAQDQLHDARRPHRRQLRFHPRPALRRAGSEYLMALDR